jgi:hypothetical protein
MTWITVSIALGGWHDAVDKPGLRREGITAVLQIHDPEAAPDASVIRCYGLPTTAEDLLRELVQRRREEL